MKALVKYQAGPGNVELRDVPKPSPGPDQVLVAVQAAGVCGSDLHILHDDIQLLVRPPVIMGHEFSGTIAELGSDVQGLEVGQRITSETSVHTCGECWPCRTGSYNACGQKELLGYVHNGAFAPYCLVPARLVHHLPEGVDFVAGALSEPLACCVHGVSELAGVQAGETVLVTGPGAIGLLSLQVAKAEGGRVLVCGVKGDEDRLSLAHQLGAYETMVVESDDVVSRVREMTRGEGADLVIECSGAPAAARLAFEAVRRRGKYLQMGLFSGPFEFDLAQVAYKELRVFGSLGQRWSAWQRALALLEAGLVQTRPLVGGVWPLSNWEEAFDRFERKEVLKAVIRPTDTDHGPL
jgi:L-iditol 2-dehydrogenase